MYRAMLMCVFHVLFFGAGAQICTAQTTMQSGGAESPPGGDRPDEQHPQLGTGNRGTGQRGSDGASSLDPSKVRSRPFSPGRVRGEVLSIQGDSYLIRDQSGNEIALHIDSGTKVGGLINMGATVEAEVEKNGHIVRLQRLKE